MTKKLITTTLSLTLLLMSYAQSINLELNLSEGQVFHQKNNYILNSTLILGEEIVKYRYEVNRLTSFKVLKTNTNSYELEVRFEKLSVGIGETKIEYVMGSDTKEQDDPYSKIVLNMIDVPFQITMTRKGRIEDIRGLDTLIANAFDTDLDITEHEMIGVKQLILLWFDQKAFVSSVEIATACYPESPVSVEDTWQSQVELKQQAGLYCTTTYTLVSSDATHNTIEGKSQIKTDKSPVYEDEDGGYVVMDLEGTLTSTLKLDTESGLVTNATMQQEMEGIFQTQETEPIPHKVTGELLFRMQ